MSSRPPAKRRRVELTIEKKIDLIKESESVPKPTLKILSEKYGVGVSTVSDILKKKIVYKEEFEKNLNPTKLRTNTCKFDKVNELVWSWFTQARAKSIPVSGIVIREKAVNLIKCKNVILILSYFLSHTNTHTHTHTERERVRVYLKMRNSDVFL